MSRITLGLDSRCTWVLTGLMGVVMLLEMPPDMMDSRSGSLLITLSSLESWELRAADLSLVLASAERPESCKCES